MADPLLRLALRDSGEPFLSVVPTFLTRYDEKPIQEAHLALGLIQKQTLLNQGNISRRRKKRVPASFKI